MESINIIKRDGTKQPLAMEKVHNRIKNLCQPMDNQRINIPGKKLNLNGDSFAIKLVSKIYNNISSSTLDQLGALEAYSHAVFNPDYEDLALRFVISDLQKNTLVLFNHTDNLLLASFSMMYNHYRKIIDNKHNNIYSENPHPLINEHIYNIVKNHADELEKIINYSLDYNMSYTGFNLLIDKYLTKINGTVVELPQHLYMRCALGIWYNHYDGTLESIIDNVRNTYNFLSNDLCTHATPTLFNAGRTNAQFSSCYLVQPADDDLLEIYNWNSECAQLSKYAGGLGSAVHKIRGRGAYIKGTDGTSNGVCSMLKIVDATSVYVDQGGGKRKGVHAIYLEMWHSDIEDFITMKIKRGMDDSKCPNLFYALWINDEFMRTVKKEEEIYIETGKKKRLWYLMSPDSSPGLYEKYDESFSYEWVENPDDNFAFTQLYRKYITEGRYVKKISAVDLIRSVYEITKETSIPYRCFKDTANRYSNQKNLGTIQCSNLCTEIYQYTSAEETAVCNLASICVNKFVENGIYNYDKLGQVAYQLTKNLDNIIDINHYPSNKAKISNLKHRPMGLGIQGLADTFILMGYEFGSDEAKELDFHIHETIYYYSLTASVDLAQEFGPYESFEGSPASFGKLKMDLLTDAGVKIQYEYMYDWEYMREKVKKGLRNSLRTCSMPTASTSTLKNNSPSIEPLNAIIYKRTDSTGEHTKYCREMVKELIDMGLWDETLLNNILQTETGTIETLSLPTNIKKKYKTAWDEGMLKNIINHSIVRNPFIDQGQSLNLFIARPYTGILNQILFYAWEGQINTASYYIRRLPPKAAKKLNVQNHIESDNKEKVCKQSSISETFGRWTTNDCETCSS